MKTKVLKILSRIFLAFASLAFALLLLRAILQGFGVQVHIGGAFLSNFRPEIAVIGGWCVIFHALFALLASAHTVWQHALPSAGAVVLSAGVFFFGAGLAFAAPVRQVAHTMKSPDGSHTVVVVEKQAFIKVFAEFYEQKGIFLHEMTIVHNGHRSALEPFELHQDQIRWSEDWFTLTLGHDVYTVEY